MYYAGPRGNTSFPEINAVTTHAVSLTYEATACQGFEQESRYVVLYSPDFDTQNLLFMDIKNTQFKVSGLIPKTRYRFSIREKRNIFLGSNVPVFAETLAPTSKLYR